MAAHPVNIITDLMDGNFAVDPGINTVFKLELLPGRNVTVTCVHTQPRAADFSIRCWFSQQPGGSSIVESGPELSFWSARRRAIAIHNLRTVDSENMVAPQAIVYNIVAEPGFYYLNVLNLSNVNNLFYFEMSVDLSL